MKKIIILSLLLLSAFVGQSQEAYKAENEGWLVSIDEAYTLSKETGKPIMANFTGSDWCGWCKKLTASVFSKKDFKTWADENVILLELDFPKRTQLPDDIKEQNAALQQAFQVRGYPTVWVFHLDKDANNGQFQIDGLGKTGYRKSVKEFTTDIESMITKYEKGK
ncbi:MAG: thioredoxin-related protein [Flavobacteriales bacterium]|jgi:thioredoxin-related protein